MQHNERGGKWRVPCGMRHAACCRGQPKAQIPLPTAIFGHFGIVVWAISLPYALFVCLASAVNTANTHTHINTYRAWEQKKSCCCNGCNISFAYAKWQQKRQRQRRRQRQHTHDDIADKREKTMQTNTLTGVD